MSDQTSDSAGKNADVSVTAFIVNESRARLESLSRDRYAKLWVTDEARQLWDELAREVYPYDDVNLSVRNRFYLEQVQRFAAGRPEGVFVNMGAGFTSYPYLLEHAGRMRCIETDYAHIMSCKQGRTREFREQGLLPEREVEFYALDMERPAGMERFETDFAEWCTERPCVVVMEGLTYYLAPATLGRLFSLYARSMLPGSKLLFDFWGPDMDAFPVIRRTKAYLSELSGGAAVSFTPMTSEFIHSIAGFEVDLRTDIAELERRYADTRVLQDAACRFPTEFAVLRKN